MVRVGFFSAALLAAAVAFAGGQWGRASSGFASPIAR